MMEKMIALQQKRRSKKGGFTLVELIVVLVILAILAALLIPALTGYIDKARDKQIIAETRQIVMAAQTLYDEEYGKGASATDVKAQYGKTDALALLKSDKILELAELTDKGTIEDLTIKANKINVLTWKSKKNNKYCKYDGNSYEVTDTAPAADKTTTATD